MTGTTMTARDASCRCGQLAITVTGEPVRVSVCNCYECQKRSRSAFAVRSRFDDGDVTVMGESWVYTHAGGSGASADFHFCPNCGGTLWYHALPDRTLYAIPVGAFADNQFPTPEYTVHAGRKHPWVTISEDVIEYRD